jgi:hypothetical protein
MHTPIRFLNIDILIFVDGYLLVGIKIVLLHHHILGQLNTPLLCLIGYPSNGFILVELRVAIIFELFVVGLVVHRCQCC